MAAVSNSSSMGWLRLPPTGPTGDHLRLCSEPFTMWKKEIDKNVPSGQGEANLR